MSDSERIENFEPDKIVWDRKNIQKLKDFLEEFEGDRSEEMLLSAAKAIFEKRIKEIHEKRTADDQTDKHSFWYNLFKLPFALRNNETTRNWVSLLVTGIGIVLFWRGIWDGSVYVFSTTGSLVVGAIILIVMALLGRRQVFKIFGGE